MAAVKDRDDQKKDEEIKKLPMNLDRDDEDVRPKCKYGIKCYRKNPDHLKQFQHPKRERSDEEDRNEVKKEGDDERCVKQLKIEEKEKEKQETEEKENEKKVPTNSKDVENESNVDDNKEELYSSVPPSPEDIKENIKTKFLVEMPNDFFEFWEFCKANKPEDPASCFHDVLGFDLVGPFDILAGKHKNQKEKNQKGRLPNYLLHWRYYFDPPEFLTVIRGDDQTQFHLGYYRDEPSELPVFVAANSAKESCTIKPYGKTIFAAINWYLSDRLKSSKGLSLKERRSLKELQEKLVSFAEERDLCLKMQTPTIKARNKKVVCKTFHGAGIVVKLDANKVGYRPVPESNANLTKMFAKICSSQSESERDKNLEPLQELLTLVQFANDECDYGEGLELGLALFCHGGAALHSPIQHLLPLAYQLLQRPQFAQIISAHLKERNSDALPQSLSELD